MLRISQKCLLFFLILGVILITYFFSIRICYSGYGSSTGKLGLPSAIFVLQSVAGLRDISLGDLSQTDVNGDGWIDLQDAVAILQIIVRISPQGGFPVNEPFAAALISKGIPEDIARFFAAAKLSSNCPSDTTCTYMYTYPNGATRQVTLTATLNQQYTPTAAELASTALVSNPVYDGKFAAIGIEDSTPPINTQIDISYFVPAASIPQSTATMPQALSLKAKEARHAQTRALGVNDGFKLNMTEIGAKGVDVGIGSILEYYDGLGTTVKTTGSVYAVASALSDIAGAATVSKETKAWMAELDALERCAANPSNSLTQTDPTYSATTVAKIRSTRAEIKQISAVRFINIMGETGEGIHPVTAVLSIPLKSIHSWSEQTLKDSSESLMRDARSAVVSCIPTCPTSLVATGVSESQIDLSWSGSIAANDVTVTWYLISGGRANGNKTAATAWSDTGLTPSTTYCYTVSAYNEYGAAENCPQACGTTFGPPVVHSTGPVNKATGVAVNSAVTATFSEAVDAATITTTGTFTLAGTGGSVAGVVTYSGLTATFTPSADLAYSTVYTATVTTGVKDPHGIAMTEKYTWSFTTEAAPVAGNIQFTTTVDAGVNTTNGVANVKWTLIENLPDVRTYTATGTISGNLAPVLSGYTCTPLPATSNINTTDKLLVYTAANTLWPNTHAFTVTANDINTTLTTNCTDNSDDSTISVQFSKLLYVFVGGNCLPSYTPQPLPFTDEAHLSGTYNCPGTTNFMGTNATWNFTL